MRWWYIVTWVLNIVTPKHGLTARETGCPRPLSGFPRQAQAVAALTEPLSLSPRHCPLVPPPLPGASTARLPRPPQPAALPGAAVPICLPADTGPTMSRRVRDTALRL